jgi:hypothetical protein
MGEEIGILGYGVNVRMYGGIEVVESRVGGASVANDGVGFILRRIWLSSVPEADKIG